MTVEVPHNIEQLNTDCTCETLDIAALRQATEGVINDPAFFRELEETRPYLLAAQPLFLSPAHAEQMQMIINSIETVAGLPSYQSAVLDYAPEIAAFRPGPVGVYMGYDFHLGADGPKLIEINSNAGGALINAYLLQAQRACCNQTAASAATLFDLGALLDQFTSSFESEWRLQGRTSQLQSIAIVDQSPREQYLYPEFVLFQRMFEAHGLTALISTPDALSRRDGALWHAAQRVDLVYNRLTDFALAGPESRVLRDAYLTGEVVVTPNPRAHALFANKKNLAILTDEKVLRRWGIAEELIATLRNGIPRTELVKLGDADELWSRRNTLFFKPSSGFGGKAAYRGDKVTRKVWNEILNSDYVAQAIVPPSTRTILIDGQIQSMKVDLRNYTYSGRVQLIAARIYEGQTTNFRTPGGGFAPVFVGNGSQQPACMRAEP
ncbi:hypothetical protein [Hyphomicrobium sp.]|uniref:hypothetical protein n=1 Tax=Hyphomicrobium sp. TaxID=82 RepID=UPI000F9086C0|nr:hypothetical protein [Hyphomicrobium sp.]RUO99842.1 MAG: hypothetical protein EKK30_05165 [Hyphomicrobium sp.]